MSNRSDIIEPYEWTENRRGGLVYSEILGWVDIGHAQGTDITALLNDFRAGEGASAKSYQVTYSQKMHINKKMLGTGKFVKWEIKKGLTVEEIHSITLAMMLTTASLFEAYQSQWFFNWHTDSGYSGEDLPSDLLGFYRAILPSDYQSRLKLISKQEALKRWDYYGPIGNYKNRGFLPLLFPDPDRQCVTSRPYKGKLPAFMTWVHPYTDFSSGKVKILSNNGTSFSFLSGV
jgi:hypothetical protein